MYFICGSFSVVASPSYASLGRRSRWAGLDIHLNVFVRLDLTARVHPPAHPTGRPVAAASTRSSSRSHPPTPSPSRSTPALYRHFRRPARLTPPPHVRHQFGPFIVPE